MGLSGDANQDGRVDVSDLGILAAHYGQTANAAWRQGDFNGDGRVDVSDLGILAGNYGAGSDTISDFYRDAGALGLVTEDDSPVSSSPGCDLAGLLPITGLLLMGLFSCWTTKEYERT